MKAIRIPKLRSPLLAMVLSLGVSVADAAYWNVFNIEGESSIDAAFATYATLPDMLRDVNRLDTFVADGSVLFGSNIVDSGSDGRTYWNLFNIEGESSVDAAFATYATLPDMLRDVNRIDTFIADGSVLFGSNIVGTGSDGKTYWNLFNVEGESSIEAAFATYATLPDMLRDVNRIDTFLADGSVLFGANIVGTGSDGQTYWNVFNIEGESSIDAAFATYATLSDMLRDVNRLDTFVADGSVLFGANIVGSGADIVRAPIPEPISSALMAAGLVLVGLQARRRHAAPDRATSLAA